MVSTKQTQSTLGSQALSIHIALNPVLNALPNRGLHLTELVVVENSRLESRVQNVARVQRIWLGPTVKINGDTSPQVSPNR